MARPLDLSAMMMSSNPSADDSSAIVIRRRLEYDAAVQQHTQHLTEVIEDKERRITELAALLERMTADFNYNLQIITELQDRCGEEAAKVAAVEQRLRQAEEDANQHKAARALLEAELRRYRQQEGFLQTEHERTVAELTRDIELLRGARERDAERWANEHRQAITDLRQQREADAAAAKVLLQEETLRLQQEMATLRSEHAKALSDAKAKVVEAETLARYHVERTSALTADLDASRGYVAAERQRVDDLAEGLREQLRRSEQQCRDLTRQVAQLEGLLAAAEERHDASLRQESAKATDLSLALSAAESAHRIVQQQLEAAKKLEAEQSMRLKEVSLDWEAKHHDVCKSTAARIRELEVALRTSEARSDEHNRSATVAQSEIGRLERELDRLREQLRATESELLNTSTNFQQTTDRLARVTAAEAKASTALRSAEAKHRDEVTALEAEVARLTTDVQRAAREQVAAAQRAKDEASELRRQLALSEAARIGVDEALAELKRHNYPTVVAQMREETGQLRNRLSLAEDERQSLLAHVKKITAELSNDTFMADLQNKARQIEQLVNDLSSERTARAAAEATARDLRVDIERREIAFRNGLSSAASRDRRSSSQGRRRSGSRGRDGSLPGGSRARSDGGYRSAHSDGEEDEEEYLLEEGPSSRGSAAPPTVARLRRELNAWRERCELLEEDLDCAIRERAMAMAELEQLRHKNDLLVRCRDDLTTLNARLNHEAKRLRGLAPSEVPAAAAALPSIAAVPQSAQPAASGSVSRHADPAASASAATAVAGQLGDSAQRSGQVPPPTAAGRQLSGAGSTMRSGQRSSLTVAGSAFGGGGGSGGRGASSSRGASPSAADPGLRKHRGMAVRNYNSFTASTQPYSGDE